MGHRSHWQRHLPDSCGCLRIAGYGHPNDASRSRVDPEDVSAYTINIKLPNDLEFQALPVILGDLPGYDMLIGMDIIGLGDFAITHPEGDTKFSFRIPSQADIDFARDDNRETSRRSRRS